MELFEALLPSGRGVRYAKIKTSDFLSAQERVAGRIGDRPDPGSARMGSMLSKELIATCLKFVTPGHLEWIQNCEGPDIDKMLDGAEWMPVTPLALSTVGDLSFDLLFEDVSDFTAMSQLIQNAMVTGPYRTDELLKKTRRISMEP